MTVCKEHPSSGLSFASRTRMRPRPRCVDWLRTAQGMCSAATGFGDVRALSTRRGRTDRVQPGCAADVFANPSLLKNAALEPQRGRTAIANERRTFQSLDTSITSRLRGSPPILHLLQQSALPVTRRIRIRRVRPVMGRGSSLGRSSSWSAPSGAPASCALAMGVVSEVLDFRAEGRREL